MNKENIKKIINFKIIIITILVFFLIWNTGMFADDYSESRLRYGKPFQDFFNLSYQNLGIMIFRIPEYLVFYHIYYFFEAKNTTSFDIFKIFIILISLKLLYDFAKVIFHNNKNSALLFSLIFVFYPSHDSALYYFQVLIYTIFLPSLLFFSLGKILKDKKLFLNRFIFFVCSFFSYSSPPYILGSIFLFYANKKKLDAFLSLLYFIGYSLLYIYLSKNFPERSRLNYETFDLFVLSKNFLLQFITSLDANLGISFFYKNYLSYFEINLTNIILIIFVAYIFFKVKFKSNKFNYTNLFFFILIFLSSLCMYGITNQYPQSPFNVANRVTIYFSPLISYLIVFCCQNLKKKLFIFFIIIIPIFLLSQHAKNWNEEKKILQKNINLQINKNSHLKNKLIFIDQFQYSKLKKINHLDYLISPWITESIFNLKNVYIIHSKVEILEDYFVDTKFNLKHSLNTQIYYYDLKKNIISKIDKKNLIDKINKKKTNPDIRHPMQLILPIFLQKIFINLYPQYKYLFNI